MTIKKPAKEGGAAIADRFRLDTPAPAAKASTSEAAGGISVKIACVAALIALGAVAGLVYTLWQHWEFLKAA